MGTAKKGAAKKNLLILVTANFYDILSNLNALDLIKGNG